MANISLVIYPNNDCALELQAKDAINSTALNGAAVTYTLSDDTGILVDSGSMTYIELTTTGFYKFRATLKDSVGITAGKTYGLVIDADGGADKRGYWEPNVVAKRRM